ncbi:MAG: ABC transporter substrate-binding protein [Bacillota bacterium]
MKKLFFLCLLVLQLVVLTSCAKNNDPGGEDIVIASANPMTGNSSDYGDMKVKAIQLAFEEVNEAGGINGRKLRLVIGDDASTPKEAHRLAEKLVADPSVLAVIGHWNSACTLAARNVYNGAKMPVITDSVNKAITDGSTPYIFRISLTDTAQAAQLAEYSVKILNFRKAAIIYANNDFGKGLKEDFVNKFRQLGGEITNIETYFEGQTRDFTPELIKIKNSGAQFIFMAGYYTEAAMIARQSRETGLGIPLIGTDGITSRELIRIGGDSVEGIRLAAFFHPAVQHNDSRKFVNAYRQKYGKEPDTYAAMAYDSARLIIKAIGANGATREDIYKYLESTEGYHGVIGDISFDANHDAQSKIIILTVKDGEFVPETLQL